VEVATFDKILGHFSPIVPPSATGVRLRRFRLGTPCGESWNILNQWSFRLGFDVTLAAALCKNLSTENTQRQLSRPKPTRVAVPTEEKEEEEEEEGKKRKRRILLMVCCTQYVAGG